jgi:hypothetical protein
MTAPFNPRRKRSILQSQAVIRAIDALRGGGQVGVGTMARLRGTTAGGGRQVGVDPSMLLEQFQKQGGAEDPNLAAARRAALVGWAGNSMFAGPNQGRYQVPDVNQETFAGLRDQSQAAPPVDPLAARRQELLSRTGPQAISEDLRKRILARIAGRRR